MFCFYDYYIMDTVLIDNDSCYEIKVKPRRPQDLVFAGKIWINAADYALRRLDLEVTKSVNINFIDKYKVQMDYEKQENRSLRSYKNQGIGRLATNWRLSNWSYW